MRPGTDNTLLTALEAQGITTAVLARLDFKSETVCVWTGAHQLQVQGSTDGVLNNRTFDPLVHGIVLDIGENGFTMAGSDAMRITLSLPSDPSQAISAASVYPDEYQGRTATLWRAMMLQPGGPGSPATWMFRRIRVGSMDTLEISNDGTSHKFILGIEGHAGMISNATGSTYKSQKSFAPNDTSQDYVEACANGSPAPTKAGNSGATGWDMLVDKFAGGGTQTAWGVLY